MTSNLMSNSRKTIAQIIIILLSLTLFLWGGDNLYSVERFNAIGLNTQGRLGIAEYFRRLVFIAEYALAILVLLTTVNIKRPFGTILLIFFWIIMKIQDLVIHMKKI